MQDVRSVTFAFNLNLFYQVIDFYETNHFIIVELGVKKIILINKFVLHSVCALWVAKKGPSGV